MLAKTRLLGKPFYYLEDDVHIGQRIALGKYEPYLSKLIMSGVGKRDVVVDVGANIGYYSLLLGSKALKVYAFEPEKRNFEILKKNIKESGLKNVKAIQKAVGREKGKGSLKLSKSNYGDHAIADKGERIEVVALDDVISENERVSFIKIDVQGWEPEVFLGAERIIERDGPRIVFEYWSKGLSRAGQDEEKMFDFLKKYYKGFYFVDEYTQIYFSARRRRFESLMKRNRIEGCNLLLEGRERRLLRERLNQYRDFSSKKYLKRLLKVFPLT